MKGGYSLRVASIWIAVVLDSFLSIAKNRCLLGADKVVKVRLESLRWFLRWWDMFGS